MAIPTRIAIDVMSGDGGVAVVADAAGRIVDQHANLHLLLVGDPDAISAAATTSKLPKDRYDIVSASQIVTMEDTAATALRGKKDSSMRVAINLVRDGEAAACVSAGNTGALATSKFVLKTLPGIDRPAIIATIPAVNGHTHMLDLGANVDCSADNLFQFATMGSILAQAVDGIAAPRVGLLNIGAEAIKGNEQVKQAAELIDDGSLNYIGYVEGDEIFTDRVDVVVCDGFVGNVSLKSSEGVARVISHYMKDEFTRNPWNKLVGLLAKPILKSFGNRIDPRRYNGASLLGLQGVVIKSHGGADGLAFANAINIAMIEIDKSVPTRIAERLGEASHVT